MNYARWYTTRVLPRARGCGDDVVRARRPREARVHCMHLYGTHEDHPAVTCHINLSNDLASSAERDCVPRSQLWRRPRVPTGVTTSVLARPLRNTSPVVTRRQTAYFFTH